MLPLVVIIGPTAVGKSKVGIQLALRLKGEIISGDSMQIYRKMDIGTAKIKPREMEGVSHHLLDIRNPDDSFSVADFQRLAEEKIKEINNRGHLPILVGGTGLYIQSVIDDYNFNNKQEDVLRHRSKLFTLAQEKGNSFVYQLLTEIDPAAAQKIHLNDLKRIIRALEYYYLTGQRFSANNKAICQQNSKYNHVLIGLNIARNLLYQRIEERVDKMMEEGLLDETRTLLARGYSPELPSLQGIGYKQLIKYLHNEYNLTTAVDLIKRDTRRFAKRQLTWFRRDTRINWIHVDNYLSFNEMIFEIMDIIGRTINVNVE